MIMTLLKYFTLVIFCVNICSSSDERKISCDVVNNLPANKYSEVSLVKGSLNISFLRSEVQVYEYKNLPLVNVLIQDVEINFNGLIRDTSYNVTNPYWGSIKTIISGSAKLTNDKTKLLNTNLELATKNNQNDEISESLQDEIFYLTKSCIDSSVSNEIGEIMKDDFLRAQNELYDFGDQAVPYLLVFDEFPNLEKPLKRVNHNATTLQSTVNIISDILIASIVNSISGEKLGVINIPNQKEILPSPSVFGDNFVKLEDGTFSGFENIHRHGEIFVGSSGLHFTVSFEVQIPNTRIHYNTCQIKYLAINSNDSITIDIGKIIFGLQFDLNYNLDPCQTSVNRLKTDIIGINPVFKHFGILNGLAKSVFDKFIQKLTPNIVSFVKVKLMQALREPLQNFKCEKYMPRF